MSGNFGFSAQITPLNSGGQPFEQYQYVDVTFETPNTNVIVPHSLNPRTPTDVIYWPVRKPRGCAISDNLDDTGTFGGINSPWSRHYIILRSNIAPITVKLLLAVPKEL